MTTQSPEDIIRPPKPIDIDFSYLEGNTSLADVVMESLVRPNIDAPLLPDRPQVNNLNTNESPNSEGINAHFGSNDFRALLIAESEFQEEQKSNQDASDIFTPRLISLMRSYYPGMKTFIPDTLIAQALDHNAPDAVDARKQLLQMAKDVVDPLIIRIAPVALKQYCKDNPTHTYSDDPAAIKVLWEIYIRDPRYRTDSYAQMVAEALISLERAAAMKKYEQLITSLQKLPDTPPREDLGPAQGVVESQEMKDVNTHILLEEVRTEIAMLAQTDGQTPHNGVEVAPVIVKPNPDHSLGQTADTVGPEENKIFQLNQLFDPESRLIKPDEVEVFKSSLKGFGDTDIPVIDELSFQEIIPRIKNVRVMASTGQIAIASMLVDTQDTSFGNFKKEKGFVFALHANGKVSLVDDLIIEDQVFDPANPDYAKSYRSHDEHIEQIKADYSSFPPQDNVCVYFGSGDIVRSKNYIRIAPFKQLHPGALPLYIGQDQAIPSTLSRVVFGFADGEFREFCTSNKLTVFTLNAGDGNTLLVDSDSSGYVRETECFMIDKHGSLTPLQTLSDIYPTASNELADSKTHLVNFQYGVQSEYQINSGGGILLRDGAFLGYTSTRDAAELAHADHIEYFDNATRLEYVVGGVKTKLHRVPGESESVNWWVRDESGIQDIQDEQLENYILTKSAQYFDAKKILHLPDSEIHPDEVGNILTSQIINNPNKFYPWQLEKLYAAEAEAIRSTIVQIQLAYSESESPIPEDVVHKIERLKAIGKQLPEVVLPRHMRVEGQSLVQNDTLEAAVRQITIRQPDGTEKKLFYKRPHEGGRHNIDSERMGISKENMPLSYDQAKELKRLKQEEYENMQVCFGENHVAPTRIIVNRDQTDSRCQVQVFQEPVERMIDVIDLQKVIPLDGEYVEKASKFTASCKEKGLNQLSDSDPQEKHLKEVIEKHKVALQEFYESYVESSLLGYVPDLLYWSPTDNLGDVGLLFTKNAGLGTDARGKEHEMIFDFGAPRLDVLTLESRKRLKDLITARKNQEGNGEKAIIRTISQHEGKTLSEKREIAPWYEDAVRAEIRESINAGKKMIGVSSSLANAPIDEQVDDIYFHLKSSLLYKPSKPTDTLERADRNYRELEGYRRLCDAPVYESVVTNEV